MTIFPLPTLHESLIFFLSRNENIFTTRDENRNATFSSVAVISHVIKWCAIEKMRVCCYGND